MRRTEKNGSLNARTHPHTKQHLPLCIWHSIVLFCCLPLPICLCAGAYRVIADVDNGTHALCVYVCSALLFFFPQLYDNDDDNGTHEGNHVQSKPEISLWLCVHMTWLNIVGDDAGGYLCAPEAWASKKALTLHAWSEQNIELAKFRSSSFSAAVFVYFFFACCLLDGILMIIIIGEIITPADETWSFCLYKRGEKIRNILLGYNPLSSCTNRCYS